MSSRCLHAGSSYVFRKPCVATSVAPKRTVTLVRECIAADSENAEVVRQVLSLNPEEWNRTKIPHLTGSHWRSSKSRSQTTSMSSFGQVL